MKKIGILTGAILLTATMALRATDPQELDGRIRSLTENLNIMQQKADRRIPAEVLRRAQGVVLLNRTKAGFLFAYKGGGGVAMLRNGKHGEWSPAAFVSANEASLGLQAGGEQDFVVILLMNTNVTGLLTQPNVELAAEARGTAGDATTGVESVASNLERPVLIYSDRRGLFAGAAIKGNAITPDEKDNEIYYSQFVTMKDILCNNDDSSGKTAIKATPPALKLAARLDDYAKIPAKKFAEERN